MFFVDNAGPDFVLGCVPLARVIAKRGATVVLVSNDHPCLNDMTVPECRAVLRALAEDDPILRYLLQAKRIRLVGSGNGYPLIDFKNISDSCNQAAQKTDLLIIEGMGRAVESNWHARFTCPALKIAMVKNDWIARQLKGKMFDLICRFELPQK
jgi:type II pantothenate kinase